MDLQEQVQAIPVIAVNPDVRGGRPFIRGAAVTVTDVGLAKNYRNQDAAAIADWYGLTRNWPRAFAFTLMKMSPLRSQPS